MPSLAGRIRLARRLPLPRLTVVHSCTPSHPLNAKQEWAGCRGSTPESRGYTCGLWQLLHALAARLPDEANAGAVWLAAVKGFIGNYFQCSECAKHFMAHASKEEALAVASRRDAALWAWRTHNIVSARRARLAGAKPAGGRRQRRRAPAPATASPALGDLSMLLPPPAAPPLTLRRRLPLAPPRSPASLAG